MCCECGRGSEKFQRQRYNSKKRSRISLFTDDLLVTTLIARKTAISSVTKVRAATVENDLHNDIGIRDS
jgi:hypothetical protein